MTPRLQGQSCNFFMTPLSCKSQRRLEYKENQTKSSNMTRKPGSDHVRIFVYIKGRLLDSCDKHLAYCQDWKVDELKLNNVFLLTWIFSSSHLLKKILSTIMSFLKKKFFLADLHKSTPLESENLQEFFKVSELVCFEGHILMAPQYLFLF